MNLSKLRLFAVACVAVTTVSLTGCVTAFGGPPPCGSFPGDRLAELAACGEYAIPLDALGEEMGYEFFVPQIEAGKNDPEFFGASIFGNKCMLVMRFSQDGEIVDGVRQAFYYAVLQKRDPAEFGWQRFVTDQPASPADIVTALEEFKPECA